MAEYIERDEAVRKAIGACIKVIGHGISQCDAVDVADEIDAIPAADVVEVVRCKDCKHAHGIDDKEPMYACTNPEIYGIGSRGAIVCVSGHFCGYGKRKGDGE